MQVPNAATSEFIDHVLNRQDEYPPLVAVLYKPPVQIQMAIFVEAMNANGITIEAVNHTGVVVSKTALPFEPYTTEPVVKAEKARELAKTRQKIDMTLDHLNELIYEQARLGRMCLTTKVSDDVHTEKVVEAYLRQRGYTVTTTDDCCEISWN